VHPSPTAGGLRVWVYMLGKSQGHMVQLICTMQANSLQAINHQFQYETSYWIDYIDQLVKFDCGTAKTAFVDMNGQILTISGKFYLANLNPLHCFKDWSQQNLMMIHKITDGVVFIQPNLPLAFLIQNNMHCGYILQVFTVKNFL